MSDEQKLSLKQRETLQKIKEALVITELKPGELSSQELVAKQIAKLQREQREIFEKMKEVLDMMKLEPGEQTLQSFLSINKQFSEKGDEIQRLFDSYSNTGDVA
jgi:hypothetical protein